MLVAEQTVLDHFGQPRRQLAVRQRAQQRHIGQHQSGLIKRTNHVLAERMVDGGLAAYRGVHLRQQGGGNLDERCAALVAGGGKAGHVADNAAAQGDQGGLALGIGTQQRVENQIERLPVLVRFAIGQHDRHHLHALGLQRPLQARQIERGNGGIGDDGRLWNGQGRQQQFDLVQQSVADMNGVAGVGQGQIEGNHVRGGFRRRAVATGPASGIPAGSRFAGWYR